MDDFSRQAAKSAKERKEEWNADDMDNACARGRIRPSAEIFADLKNKGKKRKEKKRGRRDHYKAKWRGGYFKRYD